MRTSLESRRKTLSVLAGGLALGGMTDQEIMWLTDSKALVLWSAGLGLAS